MNERIRALARQNERINNLCEIGPVQRAEVEQFVEAIILESCDVLRKWKREPFPFDEDVAVRLLKEHFGVTSETKSQ
jgi:hypothetical protein